MTQLDRDRTRAILLLAEEARLKGDLAAERRLKAEAISPEPRLDTPDATVVRLNQQIAELEKAGKFVEAGRLKSQLLELAK